MHRHSRILAVTAGLSLAGIVHGALAGAVALLLGALSAGEVIITARHLGILVPPAVLGAFIGAVLAPGAGWLLLRRVPLGRTFGGAVIGTVIGGAIGWNVRLVDSVIGAVLGAVAGCVGAAILLRRQARMAPGVDRAPSPVAVMMAARKPVSALDRSTHSREMKQQNRVPIGSGRESTALLGNTFFAATGSIA